MTKGRSASRSGPFIFGFRLQHFDWLSVDYLQSAGAVIGFLYGAYLLLTFATFGAAYLLKRTSSSTSA